MLNPRNLIATIFKKEDEMSKFTLFNSLRLLCLGVKVLYEINTTNLSKTFKNELFDVIIFQFPNVASREPVRGRNPNFILLMEFLISAKYQLNKGGKVIISAIDSPYYKGAFGFEDLYYVRGYEEPLTYKFNPFQIKGYTHMMIHKEESGIERSDKFISLIFKLKKINLFKTY
jgi:hypothetical protein